MVEELKRIAKELYEWRVVNMVDELRFSSRDDSEYAFTVQGRDKDGFEFETRGPRDD